MTTRKPFERFFDFHSESFGGTDLQKDRYAFSSKILEKWKSMTHQERIPFYFDNYHALRCTFLENGSFIQEQLWFTCDTCWPDDMNKGCCAKCACECHSGHDVKPAGVCWAVCDCAMSGCCTQKTDIFQNMETGKYFIIQLPKWQKTLGFKFHLKPNNFESENIFKTPVLHFPRKEIDSGGSHFGFPLKNGFAIRGYSKMVNNFGLMHLFHEPFFPPEEIEIEDPVPSDSPIPPPPADQTTRVQWGNRVRPWGRTSARSRSRTSLSQLLTPVAAVLPTPPPPPPATPPSPDTSTQTEVKEK